MALMNSGGRYELWEVPVGVPARQGKARSRFRSRQGPPLRRPPWLLVEVKYSKESLSGNLAHFQKQLDALFAFQIVLDMGYVDVDCFTRPRGP